MYEQCELLDKLNIRLLSEKQYTQWGTQLSTVKADEKKDQFSEGGLFTTE
jgi:hypothetical protein